MARIHENRPQHFFHLETLKRSPKKAPQKSPLRARGRQRPPCGQGPRQGKLPPNPPEKLTPNSPQEIPSGPGGSQAALAQSRRAAPRSGLKKPTQGPFGQAALISKASLRPRLTHGEAFSELATRASRFGCRFPLRQRSRTRREVCRQSRGGHPVSQLQACTQV